MKVATSDILPGDLRDISNRENTWCKAETYFQDLKDLKPGEIYVSEVIGPYLGTPLIGPYTRDRAEAKGVKFEPEKAGYAGKENPVGKRFQGLIRWAMPVTREGKVQGYVTLALDHTHVMEFSDHIVPTEERYSPISNAGSGNYAFIWDYKSRNISHPRDYFIVGYDPDTGEPAAPWMDSDLYGQWQDSGLSMSEFQREAPWFSEQSLQKKPAKEMMKAGTVGLDCRYLNFAPQCTGWDNLTQHGGSGSFVIFWSGLWKLTTAAAIPYHTGMYGKTPRGFGYVTIGANVHEFHKAATETAEHIKTVVTDYEQDIDKQNKDTQAIMQTTIKDTAINLIIYTVGMIVVVIGIAILMASALTKRITDIIRGIRCFQKGDLESRLEVKSKDEVGQISQAFNEMADNIRHSMVELKEAEDKYHSIFENALNGIFQSTPDGRFLNINPAFAHIMGFASVDEIMAEIKDSGTQLYLQPEKRDELVRRVREQGIVRDFEAQVRRKDGSEILVSIESHAVNDANGELLYLEGTIEDITAREEMEKAEREREVAEAANRAKSDFLANMSHEIRTPLNGIIGMVEIAGDSDLDDNQKNIFNTIKSESESLLGIINDVLDFSKIEAEKLELEESPFDLRALIDDISQSMFLRAEKKGVEFIHFLASAVPVRLIGDPGRLRQILVNFAGNALKFTDQGEISITAETAEDLGNKIKIRFLIKDTGIGIPKDKQATIFEGFTQADGSTTRKYGGTGLGTTISKQLAELMGGEIGVESEPGMGSTFWFTAVFIRQTGKEAVPKEVDLKGLKVLIVDNNHTNRFVLMDYLRSWGCLPEEAPGGNDALSVLRQSVSSNEPFGLILTDLQMPEMSGFDLASEIRMIEALKVVPIILLTSVGTRGDGKNCKDIGIDGYLTKPIRKDDLRKTIEMVLGLSKHKEMPADRRLITKHTIAEEYGRDIKILLVEDYPTNQQVAIRHLTAAGYLVDLAEDGRQAVEAFKQKDYDLILMDVTMPVMDGYQATAEIRAHELEFANTDSQTVTRIPIVAMTAHALKGIREKCIEEGMDDYVTKPLRRRDLLAMVEKWIKPVPEGKRQKADPAPAVHSVESATHEGHAPMNFDQALDEFEGDRELLLEILRGFLDNVSAQIEAIHQAISDGDAEKVMREAHSIKGGAANLVAHDLSGIAYELENIGKTGMLQGGVEVLEGLKREYDRLKVYAGDI